jgi:hypothetical protein
MDTLFWIVYILSAGAAFYHSFRVFSLSDPWYIAMMSAAAIDGLTAYSMAILGKWTGNQRVAGFVGITIFGLISATAQIIWRYIGMGVPLSQTLQFVSLGLVPASTTGAVIALGLMRFFGTSVTNITRQEEPIRDEKKPVILLDNLPSANGHSPVSLDKPISTNGEKPLLVEKRKPGRPKRELVFAKDASDPKAALRQN